MGGGVVVVGIVKSGGKVMGSLVVGVGVKVERPVVVLIPVVVLDVVVLAVVVELMAVEVVLALEVVLVAAVVLSGFGSVGPMVVVVVLFTGCWPATWANQE
jgi:hypothetical protein